MATRPWLETYRPKKIDEIVHHETVIHALTTAIKTGHLPNLLFHGPPGTGKTTTILALARALYGPLVSQNVLELNASSERGIDVVRKRIKTFARLAPTQHTDQKQHHPHHHHQISFKLVILDEADNMTNEAQGALRRMMEVHPSTRFCLLCNYVSRIIDPILSRTAQFRFEPLPMEAIVSRIQHISSKEGIAIQPSALTAIAQLAQGDMRIAISTLYDAHMQSQPLISSATETVSPITTTLVESVSGAIPLEFINQLLVSLSMAAKPLPVAKDLAHEIVCSGYPVTLLLQGMAELIAGSGPVLAGQDHKDHKDDKTISSNQNDPLAKWTDLQRATICEFLADTEERLLTGGTEPLQLVHLFARIIGCLSSRSFS